MKADITNYTENYSMEFSLMRLYKELGLRLVLLGSFIKICMRYVCLMHVVLDT